MKPKNYRVGCKCSTGRTVKAILGQSSQAVVYTTTNNELRWDNNDDGRLPLTLRPVIQRFDLLMNRIAGSPLSKSRKRPIYHLLGKSLFLALDLGDPSKAGRYFKPVEELLAKAQQEYLSGRQQFAERDHHSLTREPSTPHLIRRPFCDTDIKRVVNSKIKAAGKITTLDVKLQLRRDGFFAEQRAVSNAMKKLATENQWSSRASGDYLVYFAAQGLALKRHTRVTPSGDYASPSRPVVILVTVNDHETKSVVNAFLSGRGKANLFRRGGVTYNILGRHGEYDVVHTICEMGAGGVGASQQRTREAIEHWKPEAIIGVGIAFGLDKKKQAIGDVLVSTQIQDYELGRLSKNGTLTPRGDKPSCTSNLLNRFRQIDAFYQHSAQGWPKVRFGLMLSGQKLVDNIDYRSNLKSLWTEAIGGEMEGVGLYVSASAAKVDWIVVKAICDWGYNKNNAMKDEWQRLAAKNAALVVRAALA